jgi:hypothetical protein
MPRSPVDPVKSARDPDQYQIERALGIRRAWQPGVMHIYDRGLFPQ